VVLVLVYLPLLLLTPLPARVGMVMSGLDIVPHNVVLIFAIQIILV